MYILCLTIKHINQHQYKSTSYYVFILFSGVLLRTVTANNSYDIINQK